MFLGLKMRAGLKTFLHSYVNMCIFVSAIYKIYDTGYDDTVWERLAVLAGTVPILHLFCSSADRDRASKIPNIIPHYLELEETETYTILSEVQNLPEHRKASKDTKLFMILMNAKTEFLHRVRYDGFLDDHYVWIDAGISKIFKDPAATLTSDRKSVV